MKKKKNKKPFYYFIYDFVKATAAVPGLVFYRPKYYYPGGKKRIHGGALVISNHISFADPILVMLGIWYRRHHFICMREFYESRLTGWLFDRFHCIPIDRENMNIGSFRNIIECLKEDKMVSMFPEGHVNFDEETLEKFKSGMVLMALLSKKPIVPMYIEKRKNILGRLKICIGEPFDVTAPFGERPSVPEMDQIAEMLHEREEELKDYIMKRKEVL